MYSTLEGEVYWRWRWECMPDLSIMWPTGRFWVARRFLNKQNNFFTDVSSELSKEHAESAFIWKNCLCMREPLLWMHVLVWQVSFSLRECIIKAKSFGAGSQLKWQCGVFNRIWTTCFFLQKSPVKLGAKFVMNMSLYGRISTSSATFRQNTAKNTKTCLKWKREALLYQGWGLSPGSIRICFQISQSSIYIYIYIYIL